MPEIDLQAVAACHTEILTILRQVFGDRHPALITIHCVDPRHKNRTIISVTRQHMMQDYFGLEFIERLITKYGLKNFNLAAHEAIKNFAVSSLGGRYSDEFPRMAAFVSKEEVRRNGIRLVRVYSADHERDECLAAKYDMRISWQLALDNILGDLRQCNFPDCVDVYTSQVITDKSRPEGICLAAHYQAATGGQIIRVPE